MATEDAGPIAKPVSYPERWSKPRGQFGIQFLQPGEVSFVSGGDRLDLSFQVCRKHAEGFLNWSKRPTGLGPSNGHLCCEFRRCEGIQNPRVLALIVFDLKGL